MKNNITLWESCALAGYVDALPLDDGHSERAKKLAYQYYEAEIKKKNDGAPA